MLFLLAAWMCIVTGISLASHRPKGFFFYSWGQFWQLESVIAVWNPRVRKLTGWTVALRPVKPSNHKRVLQVGINHHSMFSVSFVRNSCCTENIKDSPCAPLVLLPSGSWCCFFRLALATAFSLKVICLTTVFTYMYLTTGRALLFLTFVGIFLLWQCLLH